MAKNVETLAKKNVSDDLGDIRKDIEALRNDLSSLAKHTKEEGNARLDIARERLTDTIADYRKSGRKQYKEMEKHVKDKPAQSLAMAFGAGLITSFLLRR